MPCRWVCLRWLWLVQKLQYPATLWLISRLATMEFCHFRQLIICTAFRVQSGVWKSCWYDNDECYETLATGRDRKWTIRLSVENLPFEKTVRHCFSGQSWFASLSTILNQTRKCMSPSSKSRMMLSFPEAGWSEAELKDTLCLQQMPLHISVWSRITGKIQFSTGMKWLASGSMVLKLMPTHL